MPQPTLLDFVREASSRRVCWQIGCTTCGSGDLRSGLLLLARHAPLGHAEATTDLSLFEGATRELEPLPWNRIVESPRPHLTIREAKQLAETCTEARLPDIAAAAPFPDWLGYLGMILFELARFDRCRLRIGQEWSRQFVAMGGEQLRWSRFEHVPMSWRDLALAEREQLGVNGPDTAT